MTSRTFPFINYDVGCLSYLPILECLGRTPPDIACWTFVNRWPSKKKKKKKLKMSICVMTSFVSFF